MLKDKVAVIYGAGGDVGSAVARAFAREGAKLFLSGRNLHKVEAVAADVIGRGGVAEAAQVDALDEQAVEKYVGAVAEKAGAIDISFSAISDTTGELGGALGIAVLGSVGTAVYRTELARTIPAGISPEGQDAAQHTLAGAVDVAGRLPSEIGSLLLDAARNSFIQGLQLSIIISVAIVTFAAVLVFVGLRNVRSGSEQEEKSSLASDRIKEPD